MHGLTTCIDTGTMLWGCECRDTLNKRGAHPITKGPDTAKEGTGTGNGKGNDVQYLLSLRRDFLVKMSFNYRVSEGERNLVCKNHITDDNLTSAHTRGLLALYT